MFGLELEGLSQEDREFEVAKQFVRLAGDATAQAVQAAQQGKNVQQAVKEAVTQAAQKFAPGLLQGGGNGAPAHGARSHGRWIRQGGKIVILGA
jgi:Xaa-Pro aminopeptidase